MPMSRWEFLAGLSVLPVLQSCGHNLWEVSDEPLPALAARLGICAASYVTLQNGKPGRSVALSGCSSASSGGLKTLFQAASLTKPVAALAALALLKEGRLNLAEPVSTYLPEGYQHRRNPFDAAAEPRFDRVPAEALAQIPVRSLLNHSSGLPNWSSRAFALDFAPGARWQYSGEGYLLLQAVIVAAAGQDFEAVVSRTVFERFGMRDSRLRLTADSEPSIVEGASSFGFGGPLTFREANAAASLYTTAEDYAKLMAGLFADKRLLARITEGAIPVDAKLGLSWGQGWGIEAADGGPYLWQWGNNPGFRAFAMLSVVSGNGFVLLTNSNAGMALAAPLARRAVPADHGVFRFGMLG